MAELFYPTAYKATGPWLIESSQLLALDDAIDQYRSKSLAAATAGQSVEVASDFSRTITFLLRHDKELQTSSFKEALFHPAAMSETALGFRYEVKVRGTTALLTLEEVTEKTEGPLFTSDSKEMQLNITVEPRTSQLSQELFPVLKDWAIAAQAPLWQKGIFGLRGLARFVLFFWVLIFVAGYFSTSPPNYKEHYKQEARKLLEQGINPGNQQKALELLLAIESDYSPSGPLPGVQPMHSTRSVVTNLIGIFCVSVVAFFPGFCLGIWKGKQHLQWWRTWVRIVFITVPGVIAARYLWPQLFATIERALGR